LEYPFRPHLGKRNLRPAGLGEANPSAGVIAAIRVILCIVSNSVATLANPERRVESSQRSLLPIRLCLLLLAAAGIPISLLWDFSWESTVGIDLVWSAAHTATYLAVALAGATAISFIGMATGQPSAAFTGVRLGPLQAPLGAWIALWGAAAFLSAVLFDRWWQSAYGLGAGIWHPPQILKTVGFVAALVGVWIITLRRQNAQDKPNLADAAGFASTGGLVLGLITVVTLVSIYPNHQHSAPFYKIACATYPLVLTILAVAGKLRWPATIAAICYTVLFCVMIWVLPLFAAKPQVPPIYNPMDHLMPPPFPLLLIVPAIMLDLLFQRFRHWQQRANEWLQAAAAGAGFLLVFAAAQWIFSEFLLSNLADNWFFAGGGRHWPFFLKIDPAAREMFWERPQEELNFSTILLCVGLATLSARIGLWAGAWMKRVKR